MKKFLTTPFNDAGLLVMRIGIGIMFMVHGWPKLIGGVDRWTWLGGAMSNIGIGFAPAFWGFMAAIAELVGGLLLALGLLTRPAAFLLAFTMFVAMMMHIGAGDDFVPKVSYPLELMIVFIGLMLAGAGRLSVDHKLFPPDPATKR